MMRYSKHSALHVHYGSYCMLFLSCNVLIVQYTMCRYLHDDVRFSVVKSLVCALREEKSVVASGRPVVDSLPTHVTFWINKLY